MWQCNCYYFNDFCLVIFPYSQIQVDAKKKTTISVANENTPENNDNINVMRASEFIHLYNYISVYSAIKFHVHRVAIDHINNTVLNFILEGNQY